MSWITYSATRLLILVGGIIHFSCFFASSILTVHLLLAFIFYQELKLPSSDKCLNFSLSLKLYFRHSKVSCCLVNILAILSLANIPKYVAIYWSVVIVRSCLVSFSYIYLQHSLYICVPLDLYLVIYCLQASYTTKY